MTESYIMIERNKDGTIKSSDVTESGVEALEWLNEEHREVIRVGE